MMNPSGSWANHLSQRLPHEGARLRTQGPVPLRRGEHFIANHEFAYGRGAKQRRIKMSVHVPLSVSLAIGGPVMEAH